MVKSLFKIVPANPEISGKIGINFGKFSAENFRTDNPICNQLSQVKPRLSHWQGRPKHPRATKQNASQKSSGGANIRKLGEGQGLNLFS